nr:retrotransposon protein [Tanacetum cinerariifolium]
MALSISITKAEYLIAERTCQQALWMKQAMKDYDIHCKDVLLLCDNKCAIDLIREFATRTLTPLRGVPFDEIDVEASEEYDEEMEMELSPLRVRETTYVLRTGSSRAQRHKRRVVEFEEA